MVGGGRGADRPGKLPPGAHAVTAENADVLLANAVGQLDDGADFLKLYLDGPEANVSPWTADEISRLTEMAHGRAARVTAHAPALSRATAGGVGGDGSFGDREVLAAAAPTQTSRIG